MEQLPLGFSMALAQNPDAMKRFAAMSESEKAAVLEGIHAIQSKEDMQRYVNGINKK